MDTDNDQLTDGEEVLKYHTNPLDPDTDKGGVSDGVEVRRNSNPLDASDDLPKEAPKEIPKKVENAPANVGASIVLEGVVFDVNKATIKAESEPILYDKALKTLKENPTIEVEISGHTDNTGNAKKNQKLSADRAEAVKTWLVLRGVNPSRITTRGYGQDKPIAPNDTPENKQKNRRIEFARTK